MDTITYSDENDMPVMLINSNKPSVVMNIEEAEFEVEGEVIDGMTYIHIRKQDGITLTLVMGNEGSTQLSEAMINATRVSRGLPIVDVKEWLNREMGNE